MTAYLPKHRRPRVIAGGKSLKTDLRLEGTEGARRLPAVDAADENDTSRADHMEANRMLIDGIRENRWETPRRRPPGKARSR